VITAAKGNYKVVSRRASEHKLIVTTGLIRGTNCLVVCVQHM
jgi:hypothetical protein